MRSMSARPSSGDQRAAAHEEARAQAIGEAADPLGEREHHERRRHQREAGLRARRSRRPAAGRARGRRTSRSARRTWRTSRDCRRRSCAAGRDRAAASAPRCAARGRGRAPRSALPASPGIQTCGLLQPTTGWRISASTGPARPRKVSTAPSQSTGACAAPRARAGTATKISTSVSATNGTLIAKISRHETASTR